MSVPSSLKLPPMLKDVSNSVLGRRQATVFPSTGSLKYNASNRLITFNISSEPSLLDTQKLYLYFKATFTKLVDTAVVPNQSAESFIDRIVLRVGSKVIVDTGYGYQMAESMLHHWQPAEFSSSSGNAMGISSLNPSQPLSDLTNTAGSGVVVATATQHGNSTWHSRCKRYGYAKDTNTITALASTASTPSSTFIIPIRMCGFLDGISNLIPLWILDSTISLSLDIYLSSNAQVASTFVNSAGSGFTQALATPAGASAVYDIEDLQLMADYVDVSDDYKNTINSYLANGGIYSIPSSEFNIYQFTVPTSGNEASFQLSAVYKDLEAIYIGFFQNLNNVGYNGEDQLVFPENLTSISLQNGSKYYPSDAPLDVSGRAVKAFAQTCKAFNPNGLEAGFSFPSDAYGKDGVDYLTTSANYVRLLRTETQTYFVVGFPFESLLDEDESTITGLDTSQGSGIITIRLRGSASPIMGGGGSPPATTMLVLCKYKQQVMIGQNYVVDRML